MRMQALYAGPAHFDAARTAADTQVCGFLGFAPKNLKPLKTLEKTLKTPWENPLKKTLGKTP